MTISCVDPETTPRDELDALLAAIHATRVASAAQDQPYEPPGTLDVWRAYVLAPWAGDPVRLLVACDGHGSVLGHALVDLPAHDNPHVGLMELHVAPEHRRRGVGRALLDAAAALLRTQGRRTLIMEARVGSPMECFAAAVGAQSKNADVRREQPIRTLDPERIAALRRDAEQHAVGYRLDGWLGTTPAHRRDEVAQVTLALNDAPLGELDYDDEVWYAERVARRDRFVVISGLRLHTLVAYAADGTPAGITEVAVTADGTFGWQWNTGVDPAHRGHRLGLLLKAAMVERLHALEPALRAVTTWNAALNDHMIAINEVLGYVPVDRAAQCQLDL